MPAEMYCCKGAVWPVRAKSKSLVARSRASGGSWEVAAADDDEGLAGGDVVVVSAVEEGFWSCGRPMIADAVAVWCGIVWYSSIIRKDNRRIQTVRKICCIKQ